MSKGLPIALSIPARFKEDRGAKDKGEKKPRQVFTLVKHFVLRFVKNDSLQFENERISLIVFALVLMSGIGGYIATEVGKFFFVTIMMTITGICCVFAWDSMFLDDRDFFNLMVLPIKARTLYTTKFLSVLVVVGIQSLSFSLVAAALYAYSHAGSSGIGFFFFYWFSFLLTSFLANLFVFLLVAAVQVLLILIFKGRMFAKISFLVQMVFLMGLTSIFVWFPQMYHAVPGLSYSFSSIHYYFPPLWFNGLHEKMLGAGNTIYSMHVYTALAALLVLLLLYGVSLPLTLKRYLRRPAASEQVPQLRKPMRCIKKLLHALYLRDTVQQAVFYFFINILKRSRKQKIHLAAFMALPIGFFLTYIISLHHKDLDNFNPLNPHIMGIPFIFYLLLVLGLRTLVDRPVYFDANWVFKLTREPVIHHYISGAKKAMVFSLFFPLAGFLFIFYFYIGGFRFSVSHSLYSFVTALLMLEVFFYGYKKIPFTTRQNAGNLNLKLIWPLLVAGFLFSYFIFIKLGLLLILNPRSGFIFYPVVGVIFFVLKHYRDNKERGEVLIFEEEPEELMLSLNLNP